MVKNSKKSKDKQMSKFTSKDSNVILSDDVAANINYDEEANNEKNNNIKNDVSTSDVPGVGGMSNQKVYKTKSYEFNKFSDLEEGFKSLENKTDICYCSDNQLESMETRFNIKDDSDVKAMKKAFNIKDKDNNDLRTAVIMKEILDLPISLR